MSSSEPNKIQSLPLSRILRPALGVRMEISDAGIEELARSIEQQGLLQPILVRPFDNEFEIVAGDRRFLAHKHLHRKEIKCIVKILTDVDCALARGVENLGRVDLTPLEEAAVYASLVSDMGLTGAEVARRMGKKAGHVMRRLDLLNMPADVQKAVHTGKIGVGVAEELWRIKDEGSLSYYLEFAVEHGITIAVAKQWVKEWQDKQRRKEYAGEGGGSLSSPFEPKPVYIPCDICLDPSEIGKTLNLVRF